MSDIVREQSRWAREKTKNIQEYIKQQTNFFSSVAGRGFLAMPGFMYDGQNELETDVKTKLSELNYAILVESIEREIKESGYDYDIAYRNAVMAWELDKQDMISNWEKEYGHIKQGMSNDEETLNRLEIQVQARNAILIQQKTDIEVEKEGYKKQLVELADDTTSYEIDLANKKILTANKRLELIPILEELNAAESALIAAERDKVKKDAEYTDAMSAVVDKKNTLIPYISALVTQLELYRAEISTQDELKKSISDKKVEIAEVSVERSIVQLNKATSLEELESLQAELLDLKIQIAEIRQDAELEYVTTQTTYVRELTDKEKSIPDTINQQTKLSNDRYIENKKLAIDIDEVSRIKSAKSTYGADAGKAQFMGLQRDNTEKDVAKLHATTEITATLAHLLSS